MNVLPEEFDQYLYGVGLVGERPGGDSGNPIRYTCEAFIHASDLSQTAITFHWRQSMASLRLFSGAGGPELSKEFHPLKKKLGIGDGQMTVDDIVPYIHAAMISHGQKAYHEVVSFFWANKGFYKNTIKDNGMKAFLFRHFAVLPMLSHNRPLIQKLFFNMFYPISILAIALTGVSDPKGQDNYVLSSHVAKCIPQNFITTWAYNILLKRLKKNYPGGFKELLTKFFAHEHPIASYWKE